MKPANLNPTSNAITSFYRLVRGCFREEEGPKLDIFPTQPPTDFSALARVDNMQTFLTQSFVVLNEIYKQFQQEGESASQSSYGVQVEENTEKLQRALSRVSSITKLSIEEKEALDCFDHALSAFKHLSWMLDDIEYCDKHNISRDMVKYSLSNLQEAFGYFNEWLTTSGISWRYKAAEKEKNAEKQIIDAVTQGKKRTNPKATCIQDLPNQDLNPVVLTIKDGLTLKADIEKRQIYSFSSVNEQDIKKLKEVYVGRIDKDLDVGNGLYMTSTSFLDGEEGEQKIVPIGLKDITGQVIDFYNFESPYGRSKDEIDIELPLNISSIEENKSIVLPLPIGFKLHALSLYDQNGNHISLKGVVIKSDVLGIPRLYNLPFHACKVQYRLKEDKSEGVKIDTNEEWIKTYHTPDLEQTSPIEKAIELAKARKEKVDLIKTLIASKDPIYTVHTAIRKILSVARKHNYYDVQEALGLIGHCEHMTLYFANKVRQYEIPAILVAGHTISQTSQGFQFIANAGHAQPMWLDEEGNKHFEEATHLRSINYSLCKEQVEKDLPYVLQAVSVLGKESFINLLKAISSNWRLFTNTDSEYRRTIGSSIFGENLRAYVPSFDDNYVRTAYINANKLDSLIKELSRLYTRSDVNDMVCALDRIDLYSEKSLCPEYRGPKVCHIAHALHKINDYSGTLTEFALEQAINGVTQEPITDLLLLIRSKNLTEEFRNWVSQYSNQDAIQRDLLHTLFRASATTSHTGYAEHANKAFALIYPSIDKEWLMKSDQDTLRTFAHILITQILVLSHEDKSKLLRQIAETRGGEVFFLDSAFELITDLKNTDANDISKEALDNYSYVLREIFLANSSGNVSNRVMNNVIRGLCNIIRDSSVEQARNLLTTVYKTGLFSDLIQEKEDKLLLTPGFGKRVTNDFTFRAFVRRNPEDLMTAYQYYYIACERIKLYESIGVNLSNDERIKKGVLQAVCEDYKSLDQNHHFIVPHILKIFSAGKTHLNRPLSTALLEQENNSYLKSWVLQVAEIASYFNIPTDELPGDDISEQELWSELKTAEAIDLNFVLSLLPDDRFKVAVANFPNLVNFMKVTGLTQNTSKKSQETYNSLCATIPEAKDFLKDVIKETEPAKVKTIYSNLIKKNLDLETQCRLSVLASILHRPQVLEKVSPLVARLKEALEKSSDPVILQEELMRAYEETLSGCSEWLEIRNELLALGEDSKVFSALLLHCPQCLEDTLPTCGTASPVCGTTSSAKEIPIFSKVVKNPEGSYWLDMLTREIMDCPELDIAEFLSPIGAVYIKGEEVFGSNLSKPTFKEVSLFRNGGSAYVSKTGNSKIYTRTVSKGEDFWDVRNYVPGDPVDSVYWRGFARTDKYMVKQMRNLSNPSPYHNIVDLEVFGADFKDEQIRLSQNLVNYFSFLLSRNKGNKLETQNLHVFYRGNHVASIDSNELNKIFSDKKLFLNFILQLNFLAFCAGKVDTTNQTDDYRYIGPIKNSKSSWALSGSNNRPVKSGTARLLLSNEDMIKSSIPLFESLIKSHIDVRLLQRIGHMLVDV